MQPDRLDALACAPGDSMTAPDTSPAAMPRPTHLIYINRAHVFDAGVTWTTVAGLYPHAYAPVEAFDALSAERDRLAAQVVQLQRDLDAAKVRAERAEYAFVRFDMEKPHD